MSIKVMAINGVVAFQTPGDHFVGMDPRQAHEHVTEILQAIDKARGFQEAMAGQVKSPDTCPRCKSRNITPRHRCSVAGRFLARGDDGE